MMLSKFCISTSFGLLIPAMALAQSTGSAQGQPADLQQATLALQAGQPPVSNSHKMYEDMEIMRRILNRKLGLWPTLISLNTNCAVCHVVSGNHIRNSEGKFVEITSSTGLSVDHFGTAASLGVDFGNVNQDGIPDVFLLSDHSGYDSAHASIGVPTNIEGVYLKGQGAVYTLTLPPPPRSRTLATRKTSTKPLTDWERARRAIRGDQSPPKESAPVKESAESGFFAELEKSGHLGLTEAILKILAENGHNFSQLKDDEKITVAVTFREPIRATGNQSQTGMQGGNPLAAWGNNTGQDGSVTWEGQNLAGGGMGFSGGGAMGSTMQGSGAGGGTQPGLGMGGLGGGMAGTMQKGGGGGGGTMGGKLGESGVSGTASVRDFELLGDRLVKQSKFQEAIRAFQRALNLDPPAKEAADLYRKIAQVDLVLEDIAAAKKALEMADQNLKEAAEPAKGSAKSSPANVTPPNLPSKLIISVPKKLLDQVAARKTSYADFRRQATIDFFGFSDKAAN
jgi:tetratricopeptide (TPR) repeat protein